MSTSYYAARLFIDGDDLTHLLSSVDVISNCSLLIPTFTISLTVDPRTITDDIHKSSIKLEIVTKLDSSELVKTQWDLLVTDNTDYIPQRPIMDDPTKFTPQVYKLNCIDAKAFKAASTIINTHLEYCTITDIINKITTEAGLTPRILTKLNEQVYKQILIPPMSFNKCFSYLRKQYGIATNTILKHINYKNELVVADLHELYKTWPKPILIFSRNYATTIDIDLQFGGDQDSYSYRYAFRGDPTINTVTNSNVIKLKNNQTVICYPIDTLYYTKKYVLKDLYETYSLVDEFSEMELNQYTQSTENISISYSPWEDGEEPIEYISLLNGYGSTITEVTGKLEQFKDQRHLLYDPDEYGFVADLKDYPDSVKRLKGKYIIGATHIRLTVEQNEHWSYEVTVKLIKTRLNYE